MMMMMQMKAVVMLQKPNQMATRRTMYTASLRSFLLTTTLEPSTNASSKCLLCFPQICLPTKDV